MEKAGKYIGVFAGLVSIILWSIMIFFNPYSSAVISSETIAITFMMLLAPAIVAILSIFLNKPYFMLGAFVWALPMSLYAMLTPGMFKLFGLTCFLYFVSFLLLNVHKFYKRVV